MIRNVPIKYTIKVLEKELEYFYGKYDCLYILTESRLKSHAATRVAKFFWSFGCLICKAPL